MRNKSGINYKRNIAKESMIFTTPVGTYWNLALKTAINPVTY
jgi:hypothetical protein